MTRHDRRAQGRFAGTGRGTDSLAAQLSPVPKGEEMTTRTIRLGLCGLGVALAALVAVASARPASLMLGTNNTSNAQTSLTGTTAAPEFYVKNMNGGYPAIKAESAGGGAAAVYGLHNSASGPGAGVQGVSLSTAQAAFSVHGLLLSTTPGPNSAAVRGENRGTNAYGYGVWGSHAGNGVGVFGTSRNSSGVRGESTNGTGGWFSAPTGVFGYSPTYQLGWGVAGRADGGPEAHGVDGYSHTGIGVYGQSAGTSKTGVHGVANVGPGASGVSGESSSGAGVYGYSSGGTGQGVSGVSAAPNGTGVIGTANNGAGAYAVEGTSSSGTGVYGQSTSSLGKGVYGVGLGGYGGNFIGQTGVYSYSGAANGVGVVGVASAGLSGVYGLSASDSIGPPRPAGVRGVQTGTYGVGVYGEATTPAGLAGWFEGDVLITGTCFGCTGPNSMKIDDPLDPAHKYLQHAGVASSEQLDLYSGNAVTDKRGFATVRLPPWFEALNRDFRYQLTVVGKEHWDARAAVWEEIVRNRFTIRTDQPRVRVSWAVTAVRHDPYSKARRSAVEIRKTRSEQGTYLHPEAYGKPKRAALGYFPPARIPRGPTQNR